jgi:hypothetical protein
MGANAMCEHRTGYRDPDHGFHMGVHKSFHNLLFFTHMSIQQRVVFIARVKSFAWPARCSKLELKWTVDGTKQFGNTVSMSQYRLLTFVGCTAYAGLVPDDLYKLYLQLWSLFNQVRSGDVTPSHVPIVQTFAHDVIELGATLGDPPTHVCVYACCVHAFPIGFVLFVVFY